MNNNSWHMLGLFAVIVAAFFAVDCLSLHTGDDLGYMFADSTLHGGDGPRVTSVAQCLSTPATHYLTTNGRYAVHVVVMMMLNVVPLWIFRLLNALMFGCLWLLCCNLTDARSMGTRAAALLLLLIGMPTPAMLFFTLVAYAVNYLWVAVAVAAWLWLLRSRHTPLSFTCLTAFAVGTLQESFSLPLCAAILLACLLRRLPWPVFLTLVAGTAVSVFAPGNFSHAAQGGGFSMEAISTKTGALLRDLPYTSIGWGAASLIIAAIVRPRGVIQFVRRHYFGLTVIATSLLLACLTYTSPRQLTCPCLFVILMSLSAISNIKSSRWLAAVCLTLSALFLALVATLRMPVYQRWQQIKIQNRHGAVVAFPPGGGPLAGHEEPVSYLNRAINPDPLLNRGLVAVGDRYTLTALRRLNEAAGRPANLQLILPYDPDSIILANKKIGPYVVNDQPKGARAIIKRNGRIYALH